MHFAPVHDEQRFLGSVFNVAHVAAATNDILGFTERLAAHGGQVVRFRAGHEWCHLLLDPELVKHVLQTNAKNYKKSTFGYEALRAFLGKGLLTNDDHESWLTNRRLAQPIFHRERIAEFAAIMQRHSDALLSRVRAAQGKELDLSHELNLLTLGVVGEAILGAAVERGADVIGEHMPALFEYAKIHFHSPLAPGEWWPSATNARFKRAKRELRAFVGGVIAEARRRGPDAGTASLLTMLMAAKEADTGATMDDDTLFDEVLTMILAGHETTSNALCWTFVQLMQQPEAAQGLREAVAVLEGAAPTLAQLDALHGVRQVLQESMRLMPPIWGFDRRAVADDTLGSYTIRAGELTYISPWAMHRDPRHWADPLRFDPSRFSDPQTAQKLRFTYLPFGAGPRVCIGNHFAMLEMMITLTTLTQHVRFELARPVEPWPSVTLKPRSGLWVRAVSLD